MSRVKITLPITKGGKLPVTKLEAATRQLETAITLWFFDGDPISICTLAHAAHEILTSFTKSTGSKGSLFSSEHIREEYREQYEAILRLDPNFAKHAAKDPNQTHFFSVKNLCWVIFASVVMYKGLNFGNRPLFEVFMAWMRIEAPQVFRDKIPMDCMPKSKAAFFNEMLPIATKTLSGIYR